MFLFFLKKKMREETDLLMAEENLRLREMELLTKQYEKENQLSEDINYENAIQQMGTKNIKLRNELKMVFILKEN